MKLTDLAARLDCELHGDGDIDIVRVAPIQHAEPGESTLLGNPCYTRFLSTPRASAVILSHDAAVVATASLRTADPYRAFARAIETFHQPVEVEQGIHPTAVIAPTAQLGDGATVGAYAVIGAHVRIGVGARIAPHVVIYPEVGLGDSFHVHARVRSRERGG